MMILPVLLASQRFVLAHFEIRIGLDRKQDHRMDRSWLKGTQGDALHTVLCAAGYNICWLAGHRPPGPGGALVGLDDGGLRWPVAHGRDGDHCGVAIGDIAA